MKRLTTVIIFFICVSINSQSTDELKKAALRDAKIAAEATLKSDYNSLLKHTYPPIIEVMGGKEKALEMVEKMMESMKQQGMTFEKTDVVTVSDVIKENDQYRCFVENNNQIKMGDARIFSKSFLLGIYNEQEKIWYFLEAERLNNKPLVDKILPNFQTSLNIPKDEMKTEKIE